MNNRSNKNKTYSWDGRSKAIEINGGNEDLADRLFHILLSELPERKKLLNAAFLEKDVGSMKRIAHKIKSGATYCVIDNVTYNLDTLYDALDNNASIDQIGKLIDLVNISIDDILKNALSN